MMNAGKIEHEQKINRFGTGPGRGRAAGVQTEQGTLARLERASETPEL